MTTLQGFKIRMIKIPRIFSPQIKSRQLFLLARSLSFERVNHQLGGGGGVSAYKGCVRLEFSPEWMDVCVE
jgi:hypothetical protein